MRVLHISEAMGGGISTALLSYVRSTPEIDHSLMCAERTAHSTGVDMEQYFTSVSTTSARSFAKPSLITEKVESTKPDIVHAHSSWAGLATRIARKRNMPPIVYSPHCYFHERTDVPEVARKLAERLEKSLGNRTALVAAVSPHEASIARGLGTPALFVPNIVQSTELTASLKNNSKPLIVTVGRIAPQKDPLFFARTARMVKTKIACDFVWLGDGPPGLRASIEAEGVVVSGWLPHAQVLRRMAESDLYLHTAAWEGNPMSLLEAADMDLPTIARSIPSLSSLGFPVGLTNVRAVANEIVKAFSLHTEYRRSKYRAAYISPTDHHSQGAALRHVYSAALGS